jgi:hypothetical protein
MGFVPEELMCIPPAVLENVAAQIPVEPVLIKYGGRVQPRTDHARSVQNDLGYRKAEQAEVHGDPRARRPNARRQTVATRS